ncbi:MAG: helix-turn-helix domain-containing protein [Crocosphaera sp.]
MLLNGKPLDQITESDLQGLIDNEYGERKTIEYKREVYKFDDSGKRECARDISSFANTSGGYLILGMDENNGIPINFNGIPTEETDQTISRINNIIRDRIRPSILGLEIESIKIQNNQSIIIIYIPKSFSSPHAVLEGSLTDHKYTFQYRNANGKYALDVDEIRTAFTVSQGLIDRIRDFRRERLSMIIADETPVILDKGAKLVLHLIPLNAFGINSNISINKLQNFEQQNYKFFKPPYSQLPYNGGYLGKYNLDGLLNYGYDSNNNSKYNTYLQIFRNGIIEATTKNFANDHYGDFEVKKVNFIYKDYEQEIIYCLNNYLQLQQLLNIPTPLIIFLSMVGVSSYIMGCGWPSEQFFRHTIDRDNLILPEVMIEDYNFDLYTVMKPIFDTVWNAAGYKRSLNYDEQGNWLGKK